MRRITPMLGILTTLVGLVIAAYLAQRQLIYFPTRQDFRQSELEAKQLGLEPWLHEGRFLGWRGPLTAGGATGSVLVLHGNAGAAIHRTYFRTLFQSPALGVNFDVYLLEYPGYGPRPGSPSERSLLQATDEAITLLQRDSPRPLLLVGESLGSVVAAMAGSKRPAAVQGMLLITPFANLPVLARRYYPWLPDWFLRDSFRADRALAGYPGPMAFLIAGRDTVVSPGLGKAFFDGYPGSKRLWIEANADHNTLNYNPYNPCWREILKFLMPHARSISAGSATEHTGHHDAPP